MAAKSLQSDYEVGITRACRLIGMSRSSYHYQSCRSNDSPLRLAIRQKAQQRKRWSIDFMHDSTASGRQLRILNVVDDYTREAIWMEASTSISGAHVTRTLDQLIELRGKPESLLSDNGPEFTGTALDAWTYQQKITHRFIQPGKPNQNAYVESFNGKVCDECLNEHWWRTVDHARDEIED